MKGIMQQRSFKTGEGFKIFDIHCKEIKVEYVASLKSHEIVKEATSRIDEDKVMLLKSSSRKLWSAESGIQIEMKQAALDRTSMIDKSLSFGWNHSC